MGFLKSYFGKRTSKRRQAKTQREIEKKKAQIKEYEDRHELAKLKVTERLAREEDRKRISEERRIATQRRKEQLRKYSDKARTTFTKIKSYNPKRIKP